MSFREDTFEIQESQVKLPVYDKPWLQNTKFKGKRKESPHKRKSRIFSPERIMQELEGYIQDPLSIRDSRLATRKPTIPRKESTPIWTGKDGSNHIYESSPSPKKDQNNLNQS